MEMLNSIEQVQKQWHREENNVNEVGDGEMRAGFWIKDNDWFSIVQSQLGGRLNSWLQGLVAMIQIKCEAIWMVGTKTTR